MSPRMLCLALVTLFGAALAANGVFMPVSPTDWYFAVPGVTTTGPFNQHFLRDIGLIFVLLGTAFLVGVAQTAMRTVLWSTAAVWLAGHALFHVWESRPGSADHPRWRETFRRCRCRQLSSPHWPSGRRAVSNRWSAAMPRPDERLADFEAQRPRLLRLGYRMLGSVSEAEDVVQDAWLRWTRAEDGVDAPAAYLTRIVTHLCLDQMKSARARRETYVGSWLPEPLVGSIDPGETVADDVTLTLILALERLSPLERAAFLMHDVFGVNLSEVAATLEREPAAVR